MSYQGHMADGSSVQKHSAGPLYPCVVYAQQIRPDLLWYGVITPECQAGVLCGPYDAAVEFAQERNELVEARCADERLQRAWAEYRAALAAKKRRTDRLFDLRNS